MTASHLEQVATVFQAGFMAPAEALGITTRTVHRDWVRARAWLREDLDLDRLT